MNLENFGSKGLCPVLTWSVIPADRFWWSRGLRRWSTAVLLLGLRFRILPRAWMWVLCFVR